MSNSVCLCENRGRTLVYLMKYSYCGKNKSSKIQFSRQPTAAVAVTNHIIYTRGGNGIWKRFGSRQLPEQAQNLKEARRARSREVLGSGAVHLRSTAAFAYKTLTALAALVFQLPLSSRPFQRVHGGGGGGILNNGGQPAVDHVLYMQQSGCASGKDQHAEMRAVHYAVELADDGFWAPLWAILFPVGGLLLNRWMKIPHFKG